MSASLRELAILIATRGRFRIRKRTTAATRSTFRLILSLAFPESSRGIIDFFFPLVGGTLSTRISRNDKSIVVWEIHSQQALEDVIAAIYNLEDSGLVLPERIKFEVDVANDFLNARVFKGRLTGERRESNRKAMKEREWLYELMRGDV